MFWIHVPITFQPIDASISSVPIISVCHSLAPLHSPAPGDIRVLETFHLSISDKAFEMVSVHSFGFVNSQQFQNVPKVKEIHEAKAWIFWDGVNWNYRKTVKLGYGSCLLLWSTISNRFLTGQRKSFPRGLCEWVCIVGGGGGGVLIVCFSPDCDLESPRTKTLKCVYVNHMSESLYQPYSYCLSPTVPSRLPGSVEIL